MAVPRHARRRVIRPLLIIVMAVTMAGATTLAVYASGPHLRAAKGVPPAARAGAIVTMHSPSHVSSAVRMRQGADANAATLIASAAAATTDSPSGVQAKGAALANAATGKILWSLGLNTERPIGSIVKVMTALVVIRAGDLNREITVPKSVIAYLNSQDQPSTAGLIPGDRLTALELLEALMLPSGCDAAYTLAMAYGPGLDAFIAKMNAEADSLGLTQTHFSNFDGMPWPTEYSTWSTPANLITLGLHAMRYEIFRMIAGQLSYSLPADDGHHAYTWQNTNPLIGTYPGATGIKTGDTKAAGLCLLFEATRGALTLIGVTLGSPGDDITDTGPVATRVLDWGFKNF